MKKVIPVFLAVLVGCASAYEIYKYVEKRYIVNIEGNAVAVQIGAFTKRENAINMSKNYGGIVYDDNGIYRVFYSILKSSDNINFITSYLKSSGVNYYLKSINLSDADLNKLSDYEIIMEKSNDKTKVKVNNELLNSLKRSDIT